MYIEYLYVYLGFYVLGVLYILSSQTEHLFRNVATFWNPHRPYLKSIGVGVGLPSLTGSGWFTPAFLAMLLSPTLQRLTLFYLTTCELALQHIKKVLFSLQGSWEPRKHEEAYPKTTCRWVRGC